MYAKVKVLKLRINEDSDTENENISTYTNDEAENVELQNLPFQQKNLLSPSEETSFPLHENIEGILFSPSSS